MSIKMADDFEEFCSAGGGAASPASPANSSTVEDYELLFRIASEHPDELAQQRLNDLGERIKRIVLPPSLLAEVRATIARINQAKREYEMSDCSEVTATRLPG
jgi:hypothetical protein